ncbi:uncharacterized protein C2845_PM07G19230 [Panicum miliaceum]|uniref:RING-CH-type domain-containing protein n=1 Tax=Panicum miliaceum TaxID=4540 RepID=A0A3L6SP42_PANMI|nr:uncharacterized protein C2845_PM07G19230 [Panicum miliaceum]
MADHFALMTGRLLTESTLRSAIHESLADAGPSTTAGDDRADPSVVPQDVQLGVGKAKSGVMVECRICQEEGDEAYMETPCSCKGSLKASLISSLCFPFRRRSSLILGYPMKSALKEAVERRENHGASYGHTSDQADSASSFYSQSSNTKGVMYCQAFAIALVALLVLRDAILLILRGHEMCSMELITAVHETPVLEPRGAGGLQPVPPQQQQHIINIR